MSRGRPADVVIAVKPKARDSHSMKYLDSHATSLLSWVGRLVPNPATAKLSFEVLVPAAETALEATATLASSMMGPELLIEPDLDDIGMRDFRRAAEAIAADRRAAEDALPALRAVLSVPRHADVDRAARLGTVHLDPVCGMAIATRRAPSSTGLDGITCYFYSTNCRERFEAAPHRYSRDQRWPPPPWCPPP